MSHNARYPTPLNTFITAGLLAGVIVACASPDPVAPPPGTARLAVATRQVVLTAVPDADARASPARQVVLTMTPVLEGEYVPEVDGPAATGR